MGIGVIYETFQSSGIDPVVKDELNTMERGTEIELDMLISVIEVMLSGPGDVCESMRSNIDSILSVVQNKSDRYVKKVKKKKIQKEGDALS